MTWLSDKAMERLRKAAGVPDLTDTRYRMVRELAHGGMGAVYLVEDTELGREVALKVLHLEDATGEEAARIRREAGIVARLEHPNIVPVYDAGTLADGRVFYTMKRVEGARLDEYRESGVSLPEALRVFEKVCEAVAFAHSRGIVHRDLKPENIMVGPFGEVLVMDWGTARVLGEPTPAAKDPGSHQPAAEPPPKATSEGTVIGTPAYMAPEQALGQVDRMNERTDVYLLGAILFFLIAGRPPGPPGSGGETATTIERPLAGGRYLGAKPFPRPLRAICSKAMMADPAARYATVAEVASDLARFLDGLPVTAYRETVLERLGRFAGRNKTLLLLVAAYLLVRFILLFLSFR